MAQALGRPRRQTSDRGQARATATRACSDRPNIQVLSASAGEPAFFSRAPDSSGPGCVAAAEKKDCRTIIILVHLSLRIYGQLALKSEPADACVVVLHMQW
eukprot:2052420-Pyramimonas_sp.AAC.1